MAQLITTLIIFGVAGGAAFLFYQKRKNTISEEIHYTTLTFDYLLMVVKRRVVEITRYDEVMNVSSSEYRARRDNKRRLEENLIKCIDGVRQARTIVIALIKDIIKVEVISEEDCLKLIDFSNQDFLLSQEKWEILVYVLTKKHGSDMMDYLNSKYSLTEIRNIEMDGGITRPKIEFSSLLLDEIFEEEVINAKVEFSYDSMIDIIATIIYTHYKGFGNVDSLRYLRVDGFNFGTSGSIRYEIDGKWDTMYKSTNSIWVQIDGKWIHFSFLDFGSEREMRRVMRQLSAYGNLSPMTEKNPTAVRDSPDGSRITAIGKPVGETYACFVRKFNISNPTLQQLLDKPYASNWELPAKILYFLLKSERNVPFTGQQNTGKTTMMKACIELCDLHNIRVLETSFELALREIYPWMNIFTAKPTQYTSNSVIQDTFKKTDAELSLVGEVAEDIVVPIMIQFAIIASAFTLFSHHAKDDYALVNGLANSWLKVFPGVDKSSAVSDILDVIKFNCHLDFVDGNRVIHYISEIIKENELKSYPGLDKSNSIEEAIDQSVAINREYYTRQTDRIKHTSRRIVIYNPTTRAYEANDWFTEETVSKMITKLDHQDRVAFLEMAETEFKEVRAKRYNMDKAAKQQAKFKKNIMSSKQGGVL